MLIGGVWADRLPRQRVMLASDLVRGATQAVVAVLLLTGSATLWELIVLSAVYGVAEAFFRPAAAGLVPATVSPGRLQQANALLGMTSNGAQIFGPALSGLLVALGGPGLAYAVDAGTFAVSALFLAFLRPVAVERAVERRAFIAELAGGWHEFRSRTWLWLVVASSSLYLFGVVGPFWVLGPVVAKDQLGGAGAWALIVSCFGIGAVVGGSVALRWRPSRPLLVCGAAMLLLGPWPVAFLAIPTALGAIAVAQVGCGAAMGLFAALWETTLQQQIPEDKLSRVSSYDWMGSLAFLPAGFVLAGPVSAAIGVPATLWCSAVVAVVAGAMILAVPGVRRSPQLDPGRGGGSRVIGLDDVYAAREAIGTRLHRTPMFTSRSLGDRVVLKAELFQRTGSFKVRGVLTKLASLTAEEKSRGVIGISAGNHAQALAYGASLEHIDALVVMWQGASTLKMEATRGYGAAIDLEASGPGEAFDRLAELLIETGRTLVHPFDDPFVIAGQGTVGLELIEDVPELELVVVPVGGGGLISGVATAVKGLSPSTRVIAVEPEGADSLRRGIEAGKQVRIEPQTIADGLAAPFTGGNCLAICRERVDAITIVTDEEIAEAMRFLYSRAKLACEPAGAAAVAAVLSGKIQIAPRARIACIVSGGNVATEVASGILAGQ